MNSLLGDIRYGTRMLFKRPGLSALAIVALALGIGLTTTMFSIVYAAALKGLPYERSDRLVAIFRNRPAQDIQFMPASIHDFMDWREQQKSFEAIAAFYAETVNVSGSEGRPIRYLGAYASANLFDILRVRPILGRTFRSDEDRPSSPQVLILSYRAWQDRFHGDPDIVGRTVRANADSAQQACQLANAAADVASQGGQVVGQVVATMQGISDSSLGDSFRRHRQP